MKKSIFILAASVAIASTAFSQTTTANVSQTVTLNLQNQIDIAIESATGTTLAFTSPDDYANGVVSGNASTLRVRSNKPWDLTVKAATSDFSGTPSTIPASVLSVSLKDADSYIALSTADQTLMANGARGSVPVALDYKATPGFLYEAGSYTISVVYTATQQ